VDFNAALDTISAVTAGVDVGAEDRPYADFSLEEHGLRYARVLALTEAEGLDVLVLTSEESIRYVSGYNSMIWAAAARWLPGALVVTRDPAAARLVVSAFDAGAAGGTAWTTVDPYGDPTELPARLADHVRRAAGGNARVGLETAVGSSMTLPYELLRRLVDALPPAGDASRILSTVRMLKSEAEVDLMRTAAQSAAKGYAAGLAAAWAGMTEEELLSSIGAAMLANGATCSTKGLFLNAVCGRDRHALVDAPGSSRVLAAGDTIFVDGGGPTRGYMSDIIRIGAVGEVGDQAEAWMDAAIAANAAMREAARPGIAASALYESAYAVYDDAGLARSAGVLFGHGIGLEIWERPFIQRHDDPNDDVRLRPGMTICLEPILAPVEEGELRGLFVVEDMVAISDDGAEVLSHGLERSFARIPA
jgi:Xaa-Pro aminopeptidase